MRTIFLLLFVSVYASALHAQTNWGCTDPNASNFDAEATADDGTCCYDGVWFSVTASEACYYSFSVLPNGIYVVTLAEGAKTACMRLVVQH